MANVSDAIYSDPSHESWSIEAGPDRVLLIPGFMGTPREMRPLGEALAVAGISARSIVLPGFGPEIGRLRTVRADEWLDRARCAWNETRAGSGRRILLGFSMGGAVSILLAAEAPPDVLILLAPHWRFAERLAVALPLARYVVPELRPFVRADFAKPDIRRAFEAMAPGADLDDPAVQASLIRQATLPSAALDELRRLGARAGANACRVRCRTVILQGAHDTTSLPANTRRLAVRLGGPLDMHEFPGGHHLVEPAHPSWETIKGFVLRYALGAGA
ncbi:MAG TPA: alpha/beta fold hydrolase [Thermomicrobiales bacterium]|nr:alpha/beta fold hydrolase [Thermomicrobiales bacterium]